MSDSLPLLLRAARGESVERPPVWMMRQAGRYMKIYRDLRDKYPSFVSVPKTLISPMRSRCSRFTPTSPMA